MTLTLAIPYHSNPSLLGLTLRSVLAQDDSNWRAVVCDDSVDGSAYTVVKEIVDERVSYARNPSPSGMVANWNFAVSQATTEWVTILHADDELGPGYVRAMHGLVIEHPSTAMFYCQADIIDVDGKPVFSFPDWLKRWIQPRGKGKIVLNGESGAAALLAGNFIFCPSSCYRTEILKKFPFRGDLRMVQDLDLYLRLLAGGLTIIGDTAAHYRYRRHENATAIMTRELTRFHEEIALYGEYARLFQKLGWQRARLVAARMRMIRLHLLYRMCTDFMSLRWSSVLAKFKILMQIPESDRLF